MLDLKKLDREDRKLIQMGLFQMGIYKGTFKGGGGPMTNAAYAQYRNPRPSAPFADRLAGMAMAEVGQKEVGSNGGAAVRKYQAATWYAPGPWPWCAAFVCWCFAEANRATPSGVKLPTTPGAFAFEAWARKAGAELIKPANQRAKLGDIVVFTFSHIGIVVEDQKRYGNRLVTVEGNTNGSGSREGDGVYKKSRSQSKIRSIIRIP